MEKRGNKRSSSPKKSHELSAWLAKVPLLLFIIPALIFTAITIYFINSSIRDISSTILYAAMQSIIFVLGGYSFKLKNSKSGKFMFLGALGFAITFIIIYIMDIYNSNEALFNILGIFTCLSVGTSTLMFLFAAREVVSKRK